MTQETKDKIKATMIRKGLNPQIYYNENSLKKVIKFNQSRRGKPRVYKNVTKEEMGRKISIAKTGKKRPDMAERNKGNNYGAGNKGKKRTEEVKAERRIIRSKQKFNRVSNLEKGFALLLDVLEIEYKSQFMVCNDNILTFADFYFPSSNLCLFLDGDYWHNRPGSKERDESVNRMLINNGYKVLRLWEHEIKESKSNCLIKLRQLI